MNFLLRFDWGVTAIAIRARVYGCNPFACVTTVTWSSAGRSDTEVFPPKMSIVLTAASYTAVWKLRKAPGVWGVSCVQAGAPPMPFALVSTQKSFKRLVTLLEVWPA